MNMLSEQEFITSYLHESVQALQSFAEDGAGHYAITTFADVITEALTAGRKIMIAGNGGSAADAQHIAGEFVSRLFFDHAPLAAIALTTDSSVLTAVANDYGYEKVFERQVLGLGVAGASLRRGNHRACCARFRRRGPKVSLRSGLQVQSQARWQVSAIICCARPLRKPPLFSRFTSSPRISCVALWSSEFSALHLRPSTHEAP